jgi:predicted acyltransferase (DUF342 family)
MIGVGSKVRYVNQPALVGELAGVTGTVVAPRVRIDTMEQLDGSWIIVLDSQVPGLYTGKAWAYPAELEEIQ